VVAVITGHMARGQIRERAGAEVGEGFALAGLILGYANLVLSCLGIITAILIFTGLFAFAASNSH
jgi:hypothetical protein